MSFFAGASRFFAPRKYEPSRDELERQAQDEIQARIDRGRPGPEEAARRGPRPAWTLPHRPEPATETRRLDVVAVDLNALRPVVPVVPAETSGPAGAAAPVAPTGPASATPTATPAEVPAPRSGRRTVIRG